MVAAGLAATRGNAKGATLADTVRSIASNQLGRTLTDEQTAAIVAFLGTLSGPLPKALD